MPYLVACALQGFGSISSGLCAASEVYRIKILNASRIAPATRCVTGRQEARSRVTSQVRVRFAGLEGNKLSSDRPHRLLAVREASETLRKQWRRRIFSPTP
jgi:hypothetical protein